MTTLPLSVPMRATLTSQHNRQIVRRMSVTLAILVFAIGIVAGLRSMTAPAAVSWAIHLGWLHITSGQLALLGTTAAVVILTILALGELVADKLPTTPSRTKPAPLIGRIGTAALCAAALAVAAGGSVDLAIALGALGGVAGTFGGYQVRHRLVIAAKLPDFAVALAEDLVAIGGALLIVTRLQ